MQNTFLRIYLQTLTGRSLDTVMQSPSTSKSLWRAITCYTICQLTDTLDTPPQIAVNSGVISCGTALQAGRSRVRFPMVSLEFFIDIILPTAQWPWG